MSAMVERVARAIDPATWAYIDSNDGTSATYRTAAMQRGRDAIAAMRALTPAMFSAGLGLTLERGWQAMIDEALR